MESATFETLEDTVTCSVLILCTSENQWNVTFLQQCWWPPLIHTSGQPKSNLQHPCEKWKGAKHSPETDIARNFKKQLNLTWHVAHKTIPAQSDALKQLPRTKISLMYINNDVKAAVDLCRAHHHQNQEIRNLHFSHNISRFLNSCESYQNSMSSISIEASANSKYYLWYSECTLRTHIVR